MTNSAAGSERDAKRDLQLVVIGMTGLTGRLVVEHSRASTD